MTDGGDSTQAGLTIPESAWLRPALQANGLKFARRVNSEATTAGALREDRSDRGDTVEFRQMKDGTRAEFELLHGLERQYIALLPHRILQGLHALDDGIGGYQVTRLQHSLQSATRAERDGADVEWIVAALVHDIGDALAPENHSQMAASILRPYVRAEVTWVINMHGLFQQYYYGHHLSLDRNARDAYRDHRWFDSCVNFCERWDQSAFDPDYPTETLEYFEPLLREVFSRTAFDSATGCE